MKPGIITAESIDRLINIKQQQKMLQKEIDHVRRTGCKGIKEFSRLIDRLAELDQQKEVLIRSM